MLDASISILCSGIKIWKHSYKVLQSSVQLAHFSSFFFNPMPLLGTIAFQAAASKPQLIFLIGGGSLKDLYTMYVM